MSRKEFLSHFLGALGATEIDWNSETDSLVSGTVIYELDDPEEVQDFRWHISRENTLCSTLFNLVKLIHKNELLDIDKFKINEYELKQLYCETYGLDLSNKQFNLLLVSLLNINVNMLDYGEETDIFFMHF